MLFEEEEEGLTGFFHNKEKATRKVFTKAKRYDVTAIEKGIREHTCAVSKEKCWRFEAGAGPNQGKGKHTDDGEEADASDRYETSPGR